MEEKARREKVEVEEDRRREERKRKKKERRKKNITLVVSYLHIVFIYTNCLRVSLIIFYFIFSNI